MNLCVYFCIRPNTHRSDLIVSEAKVTICVLRRTGKEELIRYARVAKPSGDSFRDYVVPFSRKDLIQVTERRSPTSGITFLVKFTVRLIPIRYGDPERHTDFDLNEELMKQVIGWDFTAVPDDVCIIPLRDQLKRSQTLVKKVLISRSDWFRKFFHKHPHASEVVMDITDNSLITFARYIYAAEIIVNPDEIFDLMRDAHKYEFYDISFAIGSLMNVKNVFHIREKAEEITDMGITDMADQFIGKNFNQFLKKENFISLPASGVKIIVCSEDISIPESEVWHLCHQWAIAELDRKGVKRTHNKERAVMLPFLKDIRFPVMTQLQFVNGPGDTLILSQAEMRDILKSIINNTNSHMFNNQQRAAQVWEEKRKAAAKKRKNRKQQCQNSQMPASQRPGPPVRPGKNPRRDNF